MNRILTITRWCWPEGSGGELATHLHLKQISTEENFQIKIATGTQNGKRRKKVKSWEEIAEKAEEIYTILQIEL